MNDERVPINLYKLDFGYNDKEINREELIKDYKQNIKKWYFIAIADIVFALIIAFANFKVPDMVMMCLFIYIAALALLIVCIHRLYRYHLQYRSINDDIQKWFGVNEMIYNKYEEQSFGILEYSGKNFIAFSEIKK